jgi:hypothetical protein
VEEILDYIEDTFPLPSLLPNSPPAEAATEDFFSKFCFYIKVNLMWDVESKAKAVVVSERCSIYYVIVTL